MVLCVCGVVFDIIGVVVVGKWCDRNIGFDCCLCMFVFG